MVNIISYFGLLLALILLIFLRPGNRYNIYLSGFFFILSLIAITRNAVFFVKDVVDCKFLVFEREYFLMLMNEFEAATPYFLQKKEDFKILSS